MQRTLLAAALALSFAAPHALAADKAKAKAKAKTPAPVEAAVPEEELSPAQLDIAPRVFTGKADCEFAQNVSVAPMEGKPGHFNVAFGKAHYTMTPQETTTGAVRLEDRHAGVVWIQIPAKSMLMDAKAGRRLVDACTHNEQRASTEGGPVMATR